MSETQFDITNINGHGISPSLKNVPYTWDALINGKALLPQLIKLVYADINILDIQCICFQATSGGVQLIRPLRQLTLKLCMCCP